MKKTLKTLACAFLMVAVCLCTGCSNNSNGGTNEGGDVVEATTPATKLEALFVESVKTTTSAEELANILAESEVAQEIGAMAMPIEPGYLNGFDNYEVTDFTSGAMFAPMIGAIPFVGYVFESENAEALAEALKANANLRWNVCTEAGEMVAHVEGNLVFFCMAPLSFEEEF